MNERRFPGRLMLLAVGLGVAPACVEVRDDALTSAANDCTACHGSAAREGSALAQAAPPRNVDGATAVSAPGVGAHQIHLTGDGRAAPVACGDCHQVPETTFAAGHLDSALPAEVILAGRAIHGERSAVYDADRGTCADSYCHGDAAPEWRAPRDGDEACGTCHGLPPAAPHPRSTPEECADCHGSVVRADGTFLNANRHVDGEIDVGALECGACHGSDDTGAPPRDLAGNLLATAPGVGAHDVHLQASTTHGAVPCDECHAVPATVDDPGHVDDERPADLVFGELSRANGSRPAYDANARSCAGSYCHGEATPDWTAPRDSDAACGSCHGTPPPAPHPARDRCDGCHGAVIDADGVFIAPERHVDGTVDIGDIGCSGCHGSGSDGAPPPDLDGSSLVTSRGVGAHTEHLVAGTTHGAIACGVCHVVPAALDDDGHRDATPQAEVSFGAAARVGGATPTFSSATLTCSGTYCHGAAQPEWTAPRSSTDACGSCHGTPPPLPHPQDPTCGRCHGDVMNLEGGFAGPELHVDGTLQLGEVPCSGCHGSGPFGAPPPSLSGSVATRERGVGAHAAHLVASPTHGAFACGECHLTPTALDAPGHRDTALPAEITFGALASRIGSDPLWSATALTCAGTYCHGTATPTWTTPRDSMAACGSCHGLPPPFPHPPVADCAQCHGDVIDGALSFRFPELHVDGTIDVTPYTCGSCHGSATNAAPPTSLSGAMLATDASVGAHQVHLSGGRYGRPVTCGECHRVPSTAEDLGHVDDWGLAEVAFSGVAAANGMAPVWDPTTLTCSGSWCHGPLGDPAGSPAWTSTSRLGCQDCHPTPPPGPNHPDLPQCDRCHGAVVDASLQIIDRTLHVNGMID